MRNHLSLLFLMAPLPALAHVGHLDVVEGHDHYIAAWALLAAIAGSLWLIRAEIKALEAEDGNIVNALKFSMAGGARLYAPGVGRVLWTAPATRRSVKWKEVAAAYRQLIERAAPDPFGILADLEAIEIANSHPYGLGSNLWSEDEDERAQFVRDIASGMAFINGMTTSYPDLPFGGVKQSGYGRELTELGMREFMNAKTVWVGAPSSEQGEGHTAGAAAE